MKLWLQENRTEVRYWEALAPCPFIASLATNLTFKISICLIPISSSDWKKTRKREHVLEPLKSEHSFPPNIILNQALMLLKDANKLNYFYNEHLRALSQTSISSSYSSNDTLLNSVKKYMQRFKIT